MPRYFWMLGLQRVARQQVGRDRWQMDCLCQTRHQQTCDERRGKADEKLFHTDIAGSGRTETAALSSFFSVRRVSGLLAQTPENTAQ